MSNEVAPLTYGTKNPTLFGPFFSFIRAHKRSLITFTVILAIPTTWIASPSLRGSVTARIDVARGRYELQSFGLPPPWSEEYERLLQQRYGIRSRAVAGCVVNSSLVAYVEAYDQVVAEAAIRRFGRDIFTECADDAAKSWGKPAAQRKTTE